MGIKDSRGHMIKAGETGDEGHRGRIRTWVWLEHGKRGRGREEDLEASDGLRVKRYLDTLSYITGNKNQF